MLQGYIATKWGDKMFEADIAKIVKRRAFLGALIMALPLFGLEWIIFTIILWNMYSALCEKAGTKLKFGTIATGFIVNIVIAIVVDFLFTLLPVLGWLGTGFIVYLQFYLSGKAYIETLRSTYGNIKSEERPIVKFPEELDNQGVQKNSDSSIAPSDNPSERGTEELLRDKDFMKQLYDSGVITYTEYSKIEKAITMEKAGVITHDQFLQELPDIVGLKIDEIKQQQLANEEKDRKRHETLIQLEQLRDAGVLTLEEFKAEKRKLYSR